MKRTARGGYSMPLYSARLSAGEPFVSRFFHSLLSDVPMIILERDAEPGRQRAFARVLRVNEHIGSGLVEGKDQQSRCQEQRHRHQKSTASGLARRWHVLIPKT